MKSNVQRTNGKQETHNVRIEVLVEGNTAGGNGWACGLEFDFSNDESFFVQPLRIGSSKPPQRMPVPEPAYEVRVAFLPPMSGLASNETLLQEGAVNVRIGEGRTAEVLRNLCYQLHTSVRDRWLRVTARIHDLFQVELEDPIYIAERGEITMSYRDRSGVRLDLSSSGRGLQQTLLLLSYLAAHPGAVLLLDEPDAHLEIIRQREIYQVLNGAAREHGSQLILATHSEVVMNEAAAANPESVIAFLGKPHRILKQATATVRQALVDIRYDQYYLAEQKGWVLYLEGQTDLLILQAFASRFAHPASGALRHPFVSYIGNQPNRGRQHFNALVEAKADLTGYLLVDRDAPELQSRDNLKEKKWQRREIENYICQPETLEAYARQLGQSLAAGPLFEARGVEKAAECMRQAVSDRVPPAALRDRGDPWWTTVKASDEFLDLALPEFFRKLAIPLQLAKADYWQLVPHVPESFVSPEIFEVLDGIAAIARAARPEAGPDSD